jgi:hypothetical protein
LLKKNGLKLKARHESVNRSNPRYLSRSIDQEVCVQKSYPKARGANLTVVGGNDPRRNPMKVPVRSGKTTSKPTSTSASQRFESLGSNVVLNSKFLRKYQASNDLNIQEKY